MNVNEFNISISEINKLIGDDKLALIEILEVFLDVSRSDLHSLYKAINEKDVTECGRIAHKISSTYGYFTGSGVAEVMGLIEQKMALGQQVSGIVNLLVEKQRTIELIESHVIKHILKLKLSINKNQVFTSAA